MRTSTFVLNNRTFLTVAWHLAQRSLSIPFPYLAMPAEHFASQTWSTSTVSLMIESFVYPQSCASKATSRKYLPLSRNLLKSQQTSFLNPVYSSRGGREQDVGVIAISTVSISLFFFRFFCFCFWLLSALIESLTLFFSSFEVPFHEQPADNSGMH